MKTWPNVNALYQIYPRSFYDVTGDGIGDIAGIIEKLDYLKGKPDSLGIDAVWISPFYPSPMADFGYDVSDYRNIDPAFGTLSEFQLLLDEAHQRDIKVIVDFVPNHTSVEHPWFKEARTSKDNDKRDYYVWREPKPDGSPPNNWISVFGGEAWTLDETTGQYYLHSFLKEQPELNWSNPRVRQEMCDILRFWLDMGVDGFRADAICHLSKDEELRDEPIDDTFDGPAWHYSKLIHTYSKNGPKLFEYLRQLSEVVESYPDRIMILENYPDSKIGSVVDQYRAFYDINPRVSMPFNFDGMFLPWSAAAFGKFLQDFQNILSSGDIPVFCFSNHDQTRIVSRFGSEQSRLIAMLQLTIPGLPTIYYGDEIGMEDGVILPEQIQDPSGKDNELGGRDPERTPMQWSNSEHAGFSTVTPWLPVAKSFSQYNVAGETKDVDSFLSLYRRLLQLRSNDLTLVKGTFKKLDSGDNEVLSYERSHEGVTYIVALNFSENPQDIFVSYRGEVLCSTHPAKLPVIRPNGELTLGPYEAIVVRT